MGVDIMGNPVADDYTIDKFFNNEEYTLLDPERVTYSIYLDNDQLFVFTPEEFPGDVESATTEIPFGFQGMKMDASYCIYYEGRPALNVTDGKFFNWRIGTQMHYTVDGVKSSSDIIYLEVFPQMHAATVVTPTSFLADWTSEPNCRQPTGFLGYDLYVVNMATSDTIVIADIASLLDEAGNKIAGGTYLIENLTPGATYEYYVVAKHMFGNLRSVASAVQEVTLPEEGHGFEPGDVNHDNAIGIADVTDLIDHLLGSDSDICLICADVNVDDEVSIADVTDLIDILLNGTN